MTDNILWLSTKALVSWKATHPAANASDFGQYWPQKDFWEAFFGLLDTFIGVASSKHFCVLSVFEVLGDSSPNMTGWWFQPI